jgi:hypothetical protein
LTSPCRTTSCGFVRLQTNTSTGEDV